MEIFNSLNQSSIVQKFEVLDYKIWQSGRYISLKIILKDESLLFAREYLDENERNYSFHWQDKNDRFIIRWDNARHHKNIRTYPHHKHTGETVTESFCPELTAMDSNKEKILYKDSSYNRNFSLKLPLYMMFNDISLGQASYSHQ